MTADLAVAGESARTVPPATGGAAQEGLTRRQFDFSGDAGDYFGICLRTFLLAVITLGIYDAWGTVERRRYMLGHSRVAGHGFDYHARPVTILIGRFVAVGVIILFNILTALSPAAALLAFAAFVLAVPWVVNRAYRFQMRNTSYRTVRFDFYGSYGRALLVYVIYPLTIPLTLTLSLPWVRRETARYVGENTAYGRARFEGSARLGPLYAAYGIGVAITVIGILLLSVLGGLIGAGFVSGLAPGVQPTDAQIGFIAGLSVIAFFLMIPVFLAAAAILGAAVRNGVVNALVLDGRHRFESTVPTGRYVWISVSNVFAITFSGYLLLPWATVRMRRFLLNHTALLADGPLDDFVAHHHEAGGAAGAEYGAMDGIADGIVGAG
jgi:uncharacterized membrane protein YjgN (DUF898 family)